MQPTVLLLLDSNESNLFSFSLRGIILASPGNEGAEAATSIHLGRSLPPALPFSASRRRRSLHEILMKTV
jgi:hypothetical protein